MTVSAILSVRNSIENGYPFVESILSVLPIVDEYLINDGGSTDGTLEVLRRLADGNHKIRLFHLKDRQSERWDGVCEQYLKMYSQAEGDWLFEGQADELIHERDALKIKHFIETTEWPIIRFHRREIANNWSQLSQDIYHPARIARNVPGLYQDWNKYGGDEFLVGSHWIDPDRHLKSPFTTYHLYNVFPGNEYNKKRNDAEWLAPGDVGRVANFKTMTPSYVYKKPESVYWNLPELAKGLVGMELYEVRESLFH